jgi:hypothetical protein
MQKQLITICIFLLIAQATLLTAEEETQHGIFGITATLPLSSNDIVNKLFPHDLTMGLRLHLFDYLVIDLSAIFLFEDSDIDGIELGGGLGF